MRILSIILMALMAHISVAGAQTTKLSDAQVKEIHKNGKAIVDEFNKYGDQLMHANRSYDLRPIYKAMAEFLVNKMKQHNLVLVVNSTYAGMDKRDYVSYHLIDSIDSKHPTIAAKLSIYFTGSLDPITTMYYVDQALFKTQSQNLKKVEIQTNRLGQYININKVLRNILEQGQHNSIYGIR